MTYDNENDKTNRKKSNLNIKNNTSKRLEPNSYFSIFLKVALFSGLILTTLITLTGTPVSQSIISGIFFGLLFGGILAFSLKGEKHTINIKSNIKRDFTYKVKTALAEINYIPEKKNEGINVYKPSFKAGFLTGRIAFQINNNKAVIVGPKIYLNKIHQKLNEMSQN